MTDLRFSELEELSLIPGSSPQYVQGGGGNTSVKVDGSLMAVKASGYKLKQIKNDEGFVVVDYVKIREYFDRVDFKSGIDYEKDVIVFTKNQVQKIEGLKDLRPSVEAGFHAILKKYVIHTHPVYGNLLSMSQRGREYVKKIFPHGDTLWIPYMNPGFMLTVKIKEAMEEAHREGLDPDIIFMENHGLIVHSHGMDDCIKLHEYVNNAIKDFFSIKEDYPWAELVKIDGGHFRSQNRYMKEFFINNEIPDDFFEENCLYPDQLVYLNDNITFDREGEKSLYINRETGEILYRTSPDQAQTMEETLLACIYIIDKVNSLIPPLKTMSGEEIGYIRSWESERYRRTLQK